MCELLQRIVFLPTIHCPKSIGETCLFLTLNRITIVFLTIYETFTCMLSYLIFTWNISIILSFTYNLRVKTKCFVQDPFLKVVETKIWTKIFWFQIPFSLNLTQVFMSTLFGLVCKINTNGIHFDATATLFWNLQWISPFL